MSAFDRLKKRLPTPSKGEERAAEPPIGLNRALSLIANERRRLLIRFVIEDADGEFDLVEAVRYIASYQYGIEYTATERKRVYISLYQTHLPELVEACVLKSIDDGQGNTFRVDGPARPLYDVIDAASARLGGEK